MSGEGRTAVIDKFKEIISNMGMEVIDLRSCSEVELKRIISKNRNYIERILIVKRGKWVKKT